MARKRIPSHNLIAYYRDHCEPPLTQAALAQALGVSMGTMHLWERNGVSTPANLLRLLRLFIERGAISDEAAARRLWATGGADSKAFAEPPELPSLFDASSHIQQTLPVGVIPVHASLPPHSLMPFRRNRLFVGRENVVEALAVALTPIGATVVVSGMAGIGKTQVATEFVHRYGRFFSGGVFWISFADVGAVATNMAACGGALHLNLARHYAMLTLDQQVALVKAAWRDPAPRLLIFDNCEDPLLLDQWQPTTGGCRVLLTSRCTQWDATQVDRVLALPLLNRDASVALLQGHCPTLPSTDAYAIAVELDDLPLALHLAGRYLARYHPVMHSAVYLAQLRAASLAHPSLERTEHSPTGYDHNVARALALSYERLDATIPTDWLAQQLLARAAHFALGEPISHDLLIATLELSDNDALRPYIADALLRLVHDIGVVDMPSGDTIRLHRLIAGLLRSRDEAHTARSAVERTLVAIAEQSTDSQDVLPALFVSHLAAVTNAVFAQPDASTVRLCNALGWHHTKQCNYTTAQHYLERAWTISIQMLGTEHLLTLHTANMLGLLFQFRRDYVRARGFFEHSLHGSEHTLGAEHVQTAASATHLGFLVMLLGEVEEAQRLFERALRIRVHIEGPETANVARLLTNIGYTAFRLHDFATTERCFAQALVLRERLFIGDHAATALSINNLGDVYVAQGRDAEAQPLFERALAMRERLFGMVHINTSESLIALGLLALTRRAFDAARVYVEQSCAINEAIFGSTHFEVLHMYDVLCEIAVAQGDEERAQMYARRCNEFVQTASAQQDRNVAFYLDNQARFFAAKRDHIRAERFHNWGVCQ